MTACGGGGATKSAWEEGPLMATGAAIGRQHLSLFRLAEPERSETNVESALPICEAKAAAGDSRMSEARRSSCRLYPMRGLGELSGRGVVVSAPRAFIPYSYNRKAAFGGGGAEMKTRRGGKLTLRKS